MKKSTVILYTQNIWNFYSSVIEHSGKSQFIQFLSKHFEKKKQLLQGD